MHGTTAKVLATIAASGWSAILSLLTTPIAVRFIGIEAYGLLGLFASLQVVVSLLDFGIGATQTRELARMHDDPAGRAAMNTLSRTHEIIYACLAVVVTGLLVLIAPLVARHWVQPGALTIADITHALRLAALALGAQWLSTYYGAGLAGLHKQTLMAAVSFPASTIRALAPILALWLIAPTLEVLFTTQIVLSALQTLLMRFLFWRAMPASPEALRFDVSALKSTWEFSAGMSAVSLTGVVLVHADKLLLSTLLPLEQFGYYMLAAALAGGINQIVGPVFGTMFPKMTQVAAINDPAALSVTYHATAQLLATLLIPIGVFLAVFPAETLFAWTGNHAIADQAKWVLTLLAIANTLAGLASVLLMIEFGQGRTRPAIVYQIAFIVALVPLITVLVRHFGAIGGAMCWTILTTVMFFVRPPVSLARLSRADLIGWFRSDIGRPALFTTTLALVMKSTLPLPPNRTGLAAALAMILAGLAISALYGADLVWKNVRARLDRQHAFKDA
jgi:O-antigen/teichoic acid export membrane protein